MNINSRNRASTATLLAVCLAAQLLMVPEAAGAEVFSRADDTRAKPPEYRKRPARYLVELRWVEPTLRAT